MADVSVYQVARQVLKASEHLLQQSARGDQDQMLDYAIEAICHAAIVCSRLQDPIGGVLLNHLNERLGESESWCALGRARARVEHAVQRQLAQVEGNDELHETLTELLVERGVATDPAACADLDARITGVRVLLKQGEHRVSGD